MSIQEKLTGLEEDLVKRISEIDIQMIFIWYMVRMPKKA